MDIEHNRKRAMIGGLTHLQLHLWVVALSLPLLFEAFRLNEPLLHLSVEPCQPETGSSWVVRSDSVGSLCAVVDCRGGGLRWDGGINW